MATIGGPNTEKDELVFGYDTGYGVAGNSTTTRFYPGEPTQNITPNYYLDWTTLSGTRTANAIEDSDGVLQGMKLTGTSSTQVRTEFTQGNPSSEDYYTFSVEGKAGSSPYIGIYSYMNPYSSPHVIYNISTNTISAATTNIHDYGVDYVRNGWYRIWMTVLIRTDQNNRIWKVLQTDSTSTSGGSNGGYVYYAKAQLENKEYATPFTTGTRSSTQSLIDLTKTTNIDVSNISFDTTGQPDFDGTNEYISLGNYDALKLGFDFSLEFVVKPEQDKWMYFFHKGYGANNALAWGRHSSGDDWFFSTYISGGYQNTYMGTATLNKYCHLVATYDGANLRLYENGVLKATSAKTHQMMNTNTSAGIGGPDRYWNGKIPVAKVYSKVLTTGEVQQNFNAYKNRFDI